MESKSETDCVSPFIAVTSWQKWGTAWIMKSYSEDRRRIDKWLKHWRGLCSTKTDDITIPCCFCCAFFVIFERGITECRKYLSCSSSALILVIVSVLRKTAFVWCATALFELDYTCLLGNALNLPGKLERAVDFATVAVVVLEWNTSSVSWCRAFVDLQSDS